MFRFSLMRLAVVLTSASILAFPAWAASATSHSKETSTLLKSDKDKLSYAIGVKTGRALKENNVDINPTVFARGLEDAMAGKESLQMSEQEIAAAIDHFAQETQQRMQAQQEKAAAKNEKLGAALLEKNKKNPEIKTTASGLQYEILTPGEGLMPTINSQVTVDYEGRLQNGTLFDSSASRGKPATFPVNGVIPGWTEALLMMRTGATWKLYIPPHLAYGSRGAPPTIGPNETLIFKVHLISIQNKNQP